MRQAADGNPATFWVILRQKAGRKVAPRKAQEAPAEAATTEE